MKENFSKGVQRILKYAKEEAVRLGHSYVGSEHLLLGIIKDNRGNACSILSSVGCDIKEMKIMIEEMVKPSGGTMTLGHLPLTRRAERVLRTTFSESQLMQIEVASQSHLLLALSKEEEGLASEILVAFNIDYELLTSFISSGSSKIDKKSKKHRKSNNKKSVTPTLDAFSRDITVMAKDGSLDPVIGRNDEIERVAQILSRRKKNNPVLIGEPGLVRQQLLRV